MGREALLIVDMSNDFVDNEGSLTAGSKAQAIVPYIVELANGMLGEGHVVVICHDTHQQDDDHFAEWPSHNVEGTWGHELFGELQNWFKTHQSHDRVLFIPKASYNAFYRTELAEKLRSFEVTKVHITGVCTDICNFLTVAGAYDEGFDTVAHQRGCATFTDNHELFLNQMKLCFHTEVVT